MAKPVRPEDVVWTYSGVRPLFDDGEGVARAIGEALDNAQLPPAAVGMIVAHGNGTPQSDVSEAAALRHVFGDAMPPVTGFKWAIGHTIAAASILVRQSIFNPSTRSIPFTCQRAPASPRTM